MIGYLYWEQGIKLMYAIIAVLAFIGTVNVYVDFSIDSNETGKNALKWYGTSLLLFVVAFCLSMIYDILK